jgi:hypothetical protein
MARMGVTGQSAFRQAKWNNGHSLAAENSDTAASTKHVSKLGPDGLGASALMRMHNGAAPPEWPMEHAANGSMRAAATSPFAPGGAKRAQVGGQRPRRRQQHRPSGRQDFSLPGYHRHGLCEAREAGDLASGTTT